MCPPGSAGPWTRIEKPMITDPKSPPVTLGAVIFKIAAGDPRCGDFQYLMLGDDLQGEILTDAGAPRSAPAE